MKRLVIAATFVGLLIVIWMAAGGADPQNAPAQPASTNPWARDQMSVLGKVTLRDGLDVFVVHIPSYPLPLSCVVLSGPQSNSIRCDDDLAVDRSLPDER